MTDKLKKSQSLTKTLIEINADSPDKQTDFRL